MRCKELNTLLFFLCSFNNRKKIRGVYRQLMCLKDRQRIGIEICKKFPIMSECDQESTMHTLLSSQYQIIEYEDYIYFEYNERGF